MEILGSIFILLGLLVRFTPLRNYITPFNMLPKADKDKIYFIKMGTFVGNSLILAGVMFILTHFIAIWLNKPEINDYGMYATIAIMIPYTLIKASSKEYKV